MFPRLCILGLGLSLHAVQGVAAERTFPLTQAEVRCTELQLERVQRRMTSVGAGDIAATMGTNAIWSASTSGGVLAGLARQLEFGNQSINDFVTGSEHFAEADLAFGLFFSAESSILDPHKAMAPQATPAPRAPTP